MIKYIVFGCICLAFSVTTIACQETNSNSLLVCGDSKVFIVDYEKSKGDKPEIVWTWDALLAEDLSEEIRKTKFSSIADTKAVNNGEQIMASSSTGGVVLVNRKDKKVLFYTDVPNAHSIEMLPNGRLVVASSTATKGNKIMLFDIEHPEKAVYTDSLYSAHGVVWEAKKESLFAIGYDVLREYKLPTKDSLTLLKEWKIPGEGGHDLYPTPDGKGLFITEHTGAWIFNFDTKKFTKIEGFPDTENIKSIGQHASGQYIFTVPEVKWWTTQISFTEPNRKLAFPGMRVYKARWLNE